MAVEASALERLAAEVEGHTGKGIIWQNWLVVKDTPERMELVHRNFDDRVRVVLKE